MRRFKRILPIFLALVMCVTSILPVYATGDVTTTSTEPTGSFSTTNGSVMFEAEDVRINTENDPTAEDYAKKNDVVRVEEIAGTTTATTASGEKAVRMRQSLQPKNNAGVNLEEIAYEDYTSNLGFDVTVDQAGSYYVWARVAVHSSSYTSIWLSTDQADYASTRVLEKDSPLYNNDNRYNPSFVWVKLATIEGKEIGESIHVDIKPRQGNAYYGVLFDTFVVTSNDTTPTDTELLSVASINGTEYASLEAAITAATDEATITLLDNCELPYSGYDKAITYDLNGHTLTCDVFTGINATVVDSSNGNNGLLKIPQDKLVFDINNDNDGYIPVWDSESNGYRFSSVTISDIEYDSSDALVFAMRPAFDSSNIEKLVAEGHETGKVRVGVRITWPGSDKPYDLPLSDDWLSTMYGGEIAKGVKLTISGGENITEFTATTIVWSEQCPYVVITSEKTHTYPATVAE